MTGMGKVRVRLFARLADVAGTRSAEVDLGEGLTAGDAYRLLCRQHPDMEGLEGSLMYAVNAEYVPAEHPLRPGDELALIPPVSGGADGVVLSRRLAPTPTHSIAHVLVSGRLTGAKNLAAVPPPGPGTQAGIQNSGTDGYAL